MKKRRNFCIGAIVLISLLSSMNVFASSYEYIDEVEFEADIDYNSSTDFDVEFYTDTDGIEDLDVSELTSSSSTIKKYKLVFTADTDEDYRFETDDDLVIRGDNLYSITSASVSSSGKKLTVKVQVKYNSTATKTKRIDGDDDSSSSSSSSSSSALVVSTTGPSSVSATSGGWSGSGDIWRYVQNGSYVGGWVNDGTGWYYCDASNDYIMKSGWFTDTDGNIYYLDSSHNGTYGKMLTGWQVVDGKQYYFMPDSGGPMGAMARNTTLVIDGQTYRFDASGTLY